MKKGNFIGDQCIIRVTYSNSAVMPGLLIEIMQAYSTFQVLNTNRLSIVNYQKQENRLKGQWIHEKAIFETFSQLQIQKINI